MRHWRETAALALAMGGPASGQTESPFAGAWCADNGEVMRVEPGHIGFNEHTVCDLPVALPESGALVADLACANIYFNDGEAVRAFERILALRAELTPEGLMLSFDHEQPALWTRCEN